MANNNEGAALVSEQPKILNPYFGEKMLTCAATEDILDKKFLTSIKLIMKINPIQIVKRNGEEAVFNKEKLRRSLQRSGASDLVIEQVIHKVNATLYDGISTKEIYKTAFALLRKSSRPSAARYKLKTAIFELGPTGFPFEKFVSEILSYEGFRTKVGVIVKGHCVNHEIDVLAEKDNNLFMVECKFHSDAARNCNVKIPLYIQSRFKDVEAEWQKQPEHDTKFHQGWLVTNTRFTSDAIQYANCAGLMLLGWDYPKTGSLKERIDESGLHPVTCLTTMTKHEKQQLLDKDIVLCKDLHNNADLLKSLRISAVRQKKYSMKCMDYVPNKN